MSFIETILRIEDERMEQAGQAVAAGWTEADHPHKCCPHLMPAPQASTHKPDTRRFYAIRLRNAEARIERLQSRLEQIDSRTQGERRADFGEINIPLKGRRERDLETTINRAQEYTAIRAQLEYVKNRAAVYADRLERLAA